jgi:hypothetical protein
VQHWQAMVYGADIDLYRGRADKAYGRLAAGMPALKKSLLLHSGFIRTYTRYSLGRLAVASIATDPGAKVARLAEARKMLLLLEREHDAWAGALARILEGMIANAEGRREAAVAALRKAHERIDATGTGRYRAPVRYRLGQLLGGDEGKALVHAATTELEGCGVHDVAKWSATFFPGTWSGPA